MLIYILLTRQLYRDCRRVLWEKYGHPVDSSKKNPRTTTFPIFNGLNYMLRVSLSPPYISHLAAIHITAKGTTLSLLQIEAARSSYTLTAQSKCQGMQPFSDPLFRDYQGTHILPSCRNPRGYQGATFQHHPWQDATQVKQGPSRSTRHMFSRIHTSVESHSAEWSTVPTMGIWCSHTL